MAAHARVEHAQPEATAHEGAGPITRYDLAAFALRYWWGVVGLWLAYSVWMFQSIVHDAAFYR